LGDGYKTFKHSQASRSDTYTLPRRDPGNNNHYTYVHSQPVIVYRRKETEHS